MGFNVVALYAYYSLHYISFTRHFVNGMYHNKARKYVLLCLLFLFPRCIYVFGVRMMIHSDLMDLFCSLFSLFLIAS